MQRNYLQVIVAFLVIPVILFAFVPTSWAAAKYRVIYNFQGGASGYDPDGALISDGAGDLYGVTDEGGSSGKGNTCGTVFELSPTKSGWVHKALYGFPANGQNGCVPGYTLVFDRKGNLYGTTLRGGQGDCDGRGCGTLFELKPTAHGQWKESVLHSFAGGADGEFPGSGPVFDAQGNLYGTTGEGGTNCKCGTVYELIRQAEGSWSETVLYSFSGTDGASPNDLIDDGMGNLYGTTTVGGVYDEGVAFELSPNPKGGWTENTIYSFEGFRDGAGPIGLTFEGRDLYGTTIVGGTGNYGTVFELASGRDGWTHSVLYSFSGEKDGMFPSGPVVFDKAGNLYGSTDGNISCVHGNPWGCGNIFKMTPHSNGRWRFGVLHTFRNGKSGSEPAPPMLRRRNIFDVSFSGGTCNNEGRYRCGFAFELTP